MPSRLRPAASVAADADPRRRPRPLAAARPGADGAAEDEQPRARAMGVLRARPPRGRELTVQATGMGGPSAALVLADLAELGVRRAVRVGSCAAAHPGARARRPARGREAHAWGGPGTREGAAVAPDPELTAALRAAARRGRPARLGRQPRHPWPTTSTPTPPSFSADAADMQTAALFGARRRPRGRRRRGPVVTEAATASASTTRRWSRRRNGPETRRGSVL